MATTTTNFGWDIPQSTDLVKDGATAIAALGQDIDTALVDLKGGTTGQVLAKASGTDLDFSWVAQDDSNAIQNAIVDAKGDLISATANDTPARLAVGTNGQILTADSTTATGLKWATPAGGSGLTLVSRTSWSAAASHTVDSVFTSTYTSYLIVIEDWVSSAYSNVPQIQLRYGSTTDAANYYGSSFGTTFSSGTLVHQSTNNAAACDFWRYSGESQGTFIEFAIERVGTGSGKSAIITGTGAVNTNAEQYKFGFQATSAQNYTGFVLKQSAGTSSGTVTVYGLAKA